MLILLAIIVGGLAFLASRDSRRQKLPPTPRGLPVIGNLHQLWTRPWITFMKWAEKYGPLFHINVAGQHTIVIANHKVAIALLERRANIYSDRPMNIVVNDFLTRGMVFAFAQHNDVWRRMRRASHEVLNKQIAKRYHNFQNVEASLLVNDLLKAPDSYENHLRRATTSLLLCIIYGLPPLTDSLDPVILKVNRVTERILTAAGPGEFLVEYLTWIKYLPSWICKWKRDAEAAFISTTALFEDLYSNVKKRVEEGDNITSVAASLVKDPIHQDLSFREKAWLAGTLYAAGSETTSKQMLWFLAAMVRHPSVQRRAQFEIDAIVGRCRLPNLDDLEALPYIRAIVKEVMRWRGVGPLGIPHRLCEDDYYEGYLLPKDTVCIVNSWGLNHDRSIYGEDADFFRPERHLDEAGINLISYPDTKEEGHITYGFGRRVCVGRHVANNNMFIQMACILWCFDIHLGNDEAGKAVSIGDDDLIHDGLMTRPVPFPCEFIPRFPEVEHIIKASVELAGFGPN
ncbi:hypothetical protein M422DRAFT_253303 [Sphaerobolus stellatus SS14]|uniref:Unplaced genomic scaffold SPHSTscaffold_48, whole genome shotgun sequence n=1 Tax=Sphaerobolus stellatus (strain SS14) TaxID=990650 RepID=A0A0C9V8X9_SPHS4|nr:hypothetical protein M422DRAFT_253303 [Sphaerobolus stellatus SS14]